MIAVMRTLWPTWASLRTIGNSAPVRASIVVPVIGYFLVLNSTLAAYAGLHGIEWSHQPATVWDHIWASKLYFVYFGLMLLGLGSIVYQWRCPRFVKKFGDWSDYVAAISPHTDPTQIYILAEMVGADFEADQYDGDMPASRDDLQKRYLHASFVQMSEHDLISRAICTTFFFGGLILLAIPSTMTAVRVLASLVSG